MSFATCPDQPTLAEMAFNTGRVAPVLATVDHLHTDLPATSAYGNAWGRRAARSIAGGCGMLFDLLHYWPASGRSGASFFLSESHG